jgi:hypothetical protein
MLGECALCTLHRELCTLHCALCTVHCALCTVNCVLCTVHCALFTVHCEVRSWVVRLHWLVGKEYQPELGPAKELDRFPRVFRSLPLDGWLMFFVIIYWIPKSNHFESLWSMSLSTIYSCLILEFTMMSWQTLMINKGVFQRESTDSQKYR